MFPELNTLPYSDLIRLADDAIIKSILSQGILSGKAVSEEPVRKESKSNTYRQTAQRPEARSHKVLTIKEKIRTCLRFAVGTIDSAMLGDALADAYVAGRESAKSEKSYSEDLAITLQGHPVAAPGEWGDLLQAVYVMVRTARQRRV